MDIKDFILIAGGTLIAMVVAHGFWIAYRARKEPLRMDIGPDLIPEDIDDMERLRGELPNGGARVIQKRLEPSQVDLELELPLLSDEVAVAEQTKAVEPQLSMPSERPKPTAQQAPPRRIEQPPVQEPIAATEPVAKVAEVQLELSPANDAESLEEETSNGETRPQARETTHTPSDTDGPQLEREVEELLVLHLVAPRGQQFAGEDLVNVLRSQGLRFGEMSIFHRVDPATKAKQFSVANIVEPGTFDMADLDALSTPGMSFFLQLPGPDQALDAFDDMLMTARNVSVELGGEVRDENLSMLTRQGAEHMRQRISDFARRRLSKRA